MSPLLTKMADVFDESTRSMIMQKVRGKENKSTELKMIEIYRQIGISGWRRGYPVKGHPDFVFLKSHIAVFVDGCFWHGHDCRNTRPIQNQEYWSKKIARNSQHDADITRLFQSRGWTVIRIWECELKKKNRDVLLFKIQPITQR